MTLHSIFGMPFIQRVAAHGAEARVLSAGRRGFDGAVAVLAMNRHAQARPTNAATFRDHVPRVVEVRAEKQMVRANTERRVASMTCHEAFGNRPVSDFPCGAMGVRRGALVPKLAVPVGANRATPEPARIAVGFLNAWPQAVTWFRELCGIGACTRAIATDLGGGFLKQHAALFARLGDAFASNADPALGIARVTAVATDFTGSAHEFHAAGDAGAVHLWRVFAEPLMALLVSLESNRHICRV